MAHPTTRRLLLPATLLGLLAGTALWFAAPRDEAAPGAFAIANATAASVGAPAAAASSDPNGERAAAAELGCYGAPAGSTFRFRIADRTDFEVIAKDGNRQSGGRLHVVAELRTTVLDRRGDEVLVRHQFGGMQCLDAAGRPIGDDPVQAAFAAAANTPVLERLAGDGAVRGFGFAAGLDGDQRNFLRGLLAVVTFRAPVGGATEWTCTEADTTGEYEAAYRREPAAATGEIAIVRTRQRYTAVGSGEVPEHELRGCGRARFSTRLGWPCGSAIDEGTTLRMPFDLQVVAARAASAELLEAGMVTVAAGEVRWAAADAPAGGVGEVVGSFAAASERRLWEQRLAGASLDQVLAEIAAALAAVPADHTAVDAAFQRLQWLVKLDARTAAAIANAVTAGQLGGDVAGVALGALGAAGTAAAQDALVAVRAERSLPLGIREQATVATLQLAAPSAELVAGLAHDAASDFDGRGNAMLVLGALAGRSAPLADGRTVAATLLAGEAEAAARGELATWLLAIGNAAPPETLAVVQRHADDADPAVRGAALAALRRVTDPAAVALLAAHGLGDQDVGVRREAVLGLGRRSEPAAREALQRIAAQETDVELRHRAEELLGSRS